MHEHLECGLEIGMGFTHTSVMYVHTIHTYLVTRNAGSVITSGPTLTSGTVKEPTYDLMCASCMELPRRAAVTGPTLHIRTVSHYKQGLAQCGWVPQITCPAHMSNSCSVLLHQYPVSDSLECLSCMYVCMQVGLSFQFHS